VASRSELAAFLEGVERRAFKQALYAVRIRDAALDIVQDAMLRLAEKYGHRPAGELSLLFHRIMQNAIRDWYRRHKVRSAWMVLASSLGSREEDTDPLDEVANPGDHPAVQHEKSQVLEMIQQELDRLPARQREAFVMRYLDELNVTETARAMRCSEGSVKTHCSRAAHALAAALKARGIEL